jgi:hypothetical protein
MNKRAFFVFIFLFTSATFAQYSDFSYKSKVSTFQVLKDSRYYQMMSKLQNLGFRGAGSTCPSEHVEQQIFLHNIIF